MRSLPLLLSAVAGVCICLAFQQMRSDYQDREERLVEIRKQLAELPPEQKSPTVTVDMLNEVWEQTLICKARTDWLGITAKTIFDEAVWRSKRAHLPKPPDGWPTFNMKCEPKSWKRATDVKKVECQEELPWGR